MPFARAAAAPMRACVNGNPGMFVSGPLLPFRARRMPEAPRHPARHCRAASLGSTRLVGQFRGQGGKGPLESVWGPGLSGNCNRGLGPALPMTWVALARGALPQARPLLGGPTHHFLGTSSVGPEPLVPRAQAPMQLFASRLGTIAFWASQELLLSMQELLEPSRNICIPFHPLDSETNLVFRP